jgi:predicted phage tail protein
MHTNRTLRGAGGGGSGSKNPTRTDDNLFSRDTVEIVLALGEGPIRGLRNGMQSFHVGGTPLMSENGSINFESFNLGVKLGHPGESPINFQLGGEASNTAVGTRLFQGTWITRQTDASLRNDIDQLQVRLQVSTLYVQNDKGSFNNTAHFHIQYRAASSPSWSEYNGSGGIAVTGKTSSGVIVEYAWNVPRINDDWVIRVLKDNPDSSTTDYCDITWESFQMVTASNRTYNRVALLHLVALATSQFSSIPDFAAEVDGLELLVPTNYNTDLHTYDEGTPWNGGFKQTWTNNNAWVLYNLIMNPDWGLAKYYPWITCNRFDFYDAGKWCDVMVPDGRGGWQPRYTFNMEIKDAQSGLDMLQYVAGTFGAVIFDDATGMVHLRVDRWEEPTLLLTPENVSPEGFSYTFTDMASRYNDLEVHFVNPDLDYQGDLRNVTDPNHIALYGHIPNSFEAIGCTSEHEALRRAYYRLITNLTETMTVTCRTARLGRIIDPYRPIYIADPTTGYSTGGRIRSIANNLIYLRDPIYFTVNQNYNLKLQARGGLWTLVVAPDMVGSAYQLRIVSGVIPPDIPDRTVFTIEDNGGFGIAKPFRPLTISPADGSPNEYDITAVEININKQAAADNCTPVGSTQYSFKNPLIPPPPTNLVAESGTAMLFLSQDGTIMARIHASWDPPGTAVIKNYLIHWKESNQSTWFETTSMSESVILAPCKTGVQYDIVVWAISSFDYRSAQLAMWNYTCLGKDEPPSDVQNFNAIKRSQDILLRWDPIADLDRAGYELRLGSNWDTAVVLVTDYAATQFAWTTTQGGSYDFLIRAIDTSHNYSRLPTRTTLRLYGPSAVTGAIAIQSGNRVDLRWNPNPEDNITDYEIREGGTWATAVFVAKVKSTTYAATAGAAGTRIFWLKAIASPGIYSDKATFVTTDIAQSDSTNILYSSDEVAKGFTGPKFNMVSYGQSLRMDDGKTRSEYFFSVNLGDVFRAQNSLFIGLNAITDDKTTWAQSTFPWNDPIANKQWSTPGDIASIGYRMEIATSSSLPSNVLYSWRLNNVLTFAGPGEDGAVTIQQTVTYKPSKYGSGLWCQTAPLQPLPTRVNFSVNIPNVFSTSFWFVPDDLTDHFPIVNLQGRDGVFIKIGYAAATQTIYALDNAGRKVSVPANIEAGERYFIGFSQNVNERMIWFGKDDGSWARSSIALPGIGATINYSLY